MASKVYAKIDTQGRITRIEGGYTEPLDLTGWTLIDEGEGYRYALCQSNYLPNPIMDDRTIYRYKLVNGEVVERTQKEMDADYEDIPVAPTQLDRIEAQTMWTALMTDTLLEE